MWYFDKIMIVWEKSCIAIFGLLYTIIQNTAQYTNNKA